MTIKYEYHFGNGKVMRFPKELTFNLLKMAIDCNGGLMKMRKIAIITENADAIEVIA